MDICVAFFCSFFPSMATSLALSILLELVKVSEIYILHVLVTLAMHKCMTCLYIFFVGPGKASMSYCIHNFFRRTQGMLVQDYTGLFFYFHSVFII